MSNIKTSSIQLGDNVTATQNFTLRTNNDGTATLARGNVGATTQDILTVDASGKPDFPALLRSLGATGTSGYYEFPGGLILQWGKTQMSTTAANVWATGYQLYPLPFTTACYGVVITGDANVSNQTTLFGTAGTNSLASFAPTLLSSISAVSGATATWFALGK